MAVACSLLVVGGGAIGGERCLLRLTADSLGRVMQPTHDLHHLPPPWKSRRMDGGTWVSIAVSVVLAFVGYRQTIGARQERIRKANGEVDAVLFKRAVSDGLVLTAPELDALLVTKAHDNRVSTRTLLSLEVFRKLLLGRVLESDLIGVPERQQLVAKLRSEDRPVQRPSVIQSGPDVAEMGLVHDYEPSSERHRELRTLLAVGLVATSGGILAAIPSLASGRLGPGPLSELLPSLIMAVGGSAVAAGVALTMLSLRRRGVDPSEPMNPPADDFTGYVRELLHRMGFAPIQFEDKGDRGFDFGLRVGSHNVAILVRPSVKGYSEACRLMVDFESRLEGGFDHGWIVMRRDPPASEPVALDVRTRVRLVPVADLPTVLAELQSRSS